MTYTLYRTKRSPRPTSAPSSLFSGARPRRCAPVPTIPPKCRISYPVSFPSLVLAVSLPVLLTCLLGPSHSLCLLSSLLSSLSSSEFLRSFPHSPTLSTWAWPLEPSPPSRSRTRPLSVSASVSRGFIHIDAHVYADTQLRDIFLHIADHPASAQPHLSPGLSQDAPPPPSPSLSSSPIPSSPPPSLSSPSSPISPPTSPHAAKVRPRSSVDSFAILRSLDPVRHALAPLNGPTNGCAEKNKETRGLRHRRGADRGAGEDGEKPKQETAEMRPTVDVLSWLGRATLDVIGEAGASPSRDPVLL